MNLTELVARNKDTEEDLFRKVVVATVLGTIQSTLTEFPYLRDVWKKNTEEENLLGVSMTGIMDHPLLSKSLETTAGLLSRLRQEAVRMNKQVSNDLGINPSTAITCVKPSGTVSQLVDSASGIHGRFSQYYVRTVRGDNKDPLTKFLKSQDIPNEPCVMKPDDITVFSFLVESPEGSVTADDMTAVEQLEHWMMFQNAWCEHKPSATVYVSEHEWPEVGAWVWKHFDDISGVSFLPRSEHTYKQAPYTALTKEEFEELSQKQEYRNIDKIDWDDLSKFEQEDNTNGSQTLACSTGGCEIVDITT